MGIGRIKLHWWHVEVEMVKVIVGLGSSVSIMSNMILNGWTERMKTIPIGVTMNPITFMIWMKIVCRCTAVDNGMTRHVRRPHSVHYAIKHENLHPQRQQHQPLS